MKYVKKVNNATNEWFDTSLFSRRGGMERRPEPGLWYSGKDAVVGPSRVNFTTSLYKSFSMTERAHFELRFESFNTFNHTQFNSLNAGGPKGDNGNFGQVTNTWDPRTLELGGKFIF